MIDSLRGLFVDGAEKGWIGLRLVRFWSVFFGGHMKIMQLILLAAAFLSAAAWAYFRPGWDSAVAAVTAGAALVAAGVFQRATPRGALKQSQSVARGGIGLQAGGDISIKGDIGSRHD